MRLLRLAATVVAALLALVLLPGSGTATSAGEEAAAAVPHVNAGDSFSAGAGVVPPAGGASPRCAQSTLNWARDLGRRFPSLVLRDVSCSGARTADYTARQYPEVAPQLDALSASTRLVTMTLGGNDGDVFAELMSGCGSAAARTGGQGSPCRDTYGSVFADRIDRATYPALVRTLAAVRSRAPNARIAISGYLQVLPPTQGCFPIVPVAAGDVPYVHGVQLTLNDAVRRAAAATGVTFLDVAPASAGHDACQPPGTRWVEPVIGSTSTVPVHPNALGERAMADRAQAVLATALRPG